MLKISKVVDLSIPIRETTPVYPGDPEISIEQAATIGNDGYAVSRIRMGSHSGTHVDAPTHFRDEGASINEVPLTRFMGEGIVLDVRDKEPEEPICLLDIEPYMERLQPGQIALFHTGWSNYLGDPKYFQHPYLSIEVIRMMLDRGILTFFIDALNIDPPDGSHFQGHELITRYQGIIGENFTNFGQITFDRPFISALPLHFVGLDGSPVRAVALQLEK